MPLDIAELERLAKAATPGTRTYDPDGQIVWGPNGEHIADMRGVGAGLPVDANGKFIAALDPQTVLALIERVRRLETENASLAVHLEESLKVRTWAEAKREGTARLTLDQLEALAEAWCLAYPDNRPFGQDAEPPRWLADAIREAQGE